MIQIVENNSEQVRGPSDLEKQQERKGPGDGLRYLTETVPREPQKAVKLPPHDDKKDVSADEITQDDIKYHKEH